MEHLDYNIKADKPKNVTTNRSALTGVVSSGNLEVMLEYKELNGNCQFSIDTAAEGFGNIWQAVISDFMERQRPANLMVSINDYAASPDVVSLRLDQAYEAFLNQEV